mgnify:CR=1 FL=1
MIRSLLKNIVAMVPLTFAEKYLISKFGYNLLSFSQYGEDIILRNIFSGKKTGFFVDVGAHHPTRFSNTYWFYRKGWRGINIDAAPGSMAPFNKKRSGDKNIEAAISNTKETLEFNVLNHAAFSTFSKKLAEEHVKEGYWIKDVVQIQTKTLKEVLDENLSGVEKIDFVNIDVESYDLEVLKSNDWNKYVPEVIVIEDRELSNEGSEIVSYLNEKGYNLVATMEKTKIFKKNI